jgi:hypothetical protein
VRIAPAAQLEKTPRKGWPVFVVAALLALAGFGMWKKQRAPAPSPVPVPAATVPAVPVAAPAAPSAHVDPAQRDAAQRLKQEFEREFKAADANGDGYLSEAEARRFPALERNFRRADSDGDGRISLAEFVHAKRAMLERRLTK